MQTIVYAVYAKLNSILDFTDYINHIELLTKKDGLSNLDGLNIYI